jgi:hypothetical protein
VSPGSLSSGPSHWLARLSWPGSADHLALVRIVLGCFLITSLASPAIPYLLEIPAGTFPTTLSVIPPAAELFFFHHMWTVLHVGMVASLLVVLGLFTRVALPVLLITYLVSQNYYYRALTAHDDWLYFIFPLLVLCFARSNDAFSLDAWLAARRGEPLRSADAREYRWPIELMTLWIAVLYGAAGVAKLFPLRKGLVWLNGASAQNMTMHYMLDSPIFFLLETTPFDYGVRWPFTILSIGAAVIELSAIALLFWRKAAWLVVPALLSMHLGIYAFGISGFSTLLLVSSVALLDPQGVERGFARLLPSRGSHPPAR